MRGYLSGLIWGLVFATSGIAVLSLLSPVGPRPDVGTDVADSVTPDPETPKISGIAASKPDAEMEETPPAAPDPTAAKTGTRTTIDTANTTPVSKPQVSKTTKNLTTPGDTPDASGVAVATESPIAPVAPTPAPITPVAETSTQVPADSVAQPTVPVVSDATAGLESAPSSEDLSPTISTQTESPLIATAPLAKVSKPVAETAPAPSTTPAPAPKPVPTPDVAVEIAPAPSPEPDVTVEIAPTAEIEPTPAPAPQKDPAPQPEPNPETATAPVTIITENPQVSVLPQTGTGDGELRPTIGRRVVPLTERGQPAAATQTAPAAPVQTDNGTPLTRFAATFDNPDNKPMMAIVLIDDDRSLGTEALKDFPYPLTFAVNPTAPGAAEKMARHRAAGFEVLALVDLPTQAVAQDAEVALAASFETLNEAVGVLEGTGTGIQGNRSLSDQVTAFVNATGRGMITQNNGLNTVHKLAARNGVPAAVVFRDFDGAGQTPIIMRRFLDQAAFRAGQEGGVIMMGRVRPDTISALLLWGLQDRANRVALAPVSALLTQNATAQ